MRKKSNINWMKKEKKANDKAQQEFESSFFNTARNLIHGELSSTPATSFFPRYFIEASAKREWLVTKSKGPAASYFIRWHRAYNKRRRNFEQASRAKCVAACVWLWKQTKSSFKLWKY